jgi:hypothetical protein
MFGDITKIFSKDIGFNFKKKNTFKDNFSLLGNSKQKAIS